MDYLNLWPGIFSRYEVYNCNSTDILDLIYFSEIILHLNIWNNIKGYIAYMTDFLSKARIS